MPPAVSPQRDGGPRRVRLQKAAEETGHAALAYRDLEALGLPASEVVRLVQPPSAKAFADRFRAYVESSTPIVLFGLSYCLERMAVARDDAYIRKVEAVCPPGTRADRFLKVHSGVGTETPRLRAAVALRVADGARARSGRPCGVRDRTDARPATTGGSTLSDEGIGRRRRLAGIEVSDFLTVPGKQQTEIPI